MIPVAFLQLYSVLRKCAQSTFEQNEGLMWNHGNKPDKNSAGWITRAQLLYCLNLLHPPLSFFFYVPLSSQPLLAQTHVARWPSFTAGWHTRQKQVKIFQCTRFLFPFMSNWGIDKPLATLTDISENLCALEYQPVSNFISSTLNLPTRSLKGFICLSPL